MFAAKSPTTEPRQRKLLRSGSRDNEQFANVLFLSGTLFIVVLFAGAYHYGVSKQKNLGQTRSYDLHQRGEYARRQLAECQSKTGLSADKAANLKGESAELWNNNKQLEEENERLVRLNEKLEKKNVECTENAELQKQAWRSEDKKYSSKLAKLDRRNRLLRRKAKRLRGGAVQGMRTILLLATIKKLGEENSHWRRQNKLTERKVSQDYVDELVAKWNRVDPTAMGSNRGEILTPLKSEIWTNLQKKKARILDHYDPDKHGEAIFLPKKDEVTGEWRLPGWNGRYGTQDLRHGTFVNSRMCPVSNINRQMRVLYEYALCAVANNVSQFMYPTAFKRCQDCHTEYMHNYVETPLVLFCDDCRPMHGAPEFKLLCQGSGSDVQYGSKLFWRARSRLRFRGRFLTLAEEFLEDKHLTANQFVSVRLPREEQRRVCEKAAQHRTPVLSYTKLLKGRDGVRELSDDGEFDKQCLPAWDHVYDSLNKVVARVGRGAKVYVSSDMSEQEWYRLKKKVPGGKLYRRRSTGRPTEDDIIDSYVAAHASQQVLNRYDIKSAHINEAHMLLNELAIAATWVW